MISLRHLLFTIITFGLIAALVFLYNKTEAVNLGKHNDIVDQLRLLQDTDVRWDFDLQRMRSDMEPGQNSVSNRTIAANNALRALTNAVPLVDSPALRAELPRIARAMNEKAVLVEKYRVANNIAKDALRNITQIEDEPAAPVVIPQGNSRLQDRKNKRLAGQQAERQRQLTGAIDRLAAAASGYYWQDKDGQLAELEAAAKHVTDLSDNFDDLAHERAAALNDAARTLRAAIAGERDLSARISAVITGPRLNGLVISLNRELGETLAEKERFRVYMIAYAAALLIGIGYLGIRIVAANEMLERRVDERTRELSDALKHLKESEAQLVQSEKMSSLGQMVAGVAHEINTPLAYVKNSLNTVNERLPVITSAVANAEQLLGLLNDPNVQPEVLNRQFSLLAGELAEIKQQDLLPELAGLVTDGIYGTTQVAEIVSNLKDFSRLDRNKVGRFNLNDGLNSTLGLARHLLKSVNVNKQYGEIPEITCAPSQINQVFLNLITNAAQALPAHNGVITLVSRGEKDGVTVEVSDNGSGIPPDVLPKIFDPFFTTKEIGKGTGLGLSISYKIVKDHGGTIRAESQAGHGTKFTVWLPVNPPSGNELSA